MTRQMPVAEMPGDAHELRRAWHADLRQLLRRRHDAHAPAVLEHERIAVAQPLRLRQVEQELEAAAPVMVDAAAMPQVVVERHASSSSP